MQESMRLQILKSAKKLTCNHKRSFGGKSSTAEFQMIVGAGPKLNASPKAMDADLTAIMAIKKKHSPGSRAP